MKVDTCTASTSVILLCAEIPDCFKVQEKHSPTLVGSLTKKLVRFYQELAVS